MRILSVCVAAALAVSASGAALAQGDANGFKSGAMVVTADGKRIGRIERVVQDSDGKPVAVKLIYNSEFITIPTSTMSPSDRGYSTTLTRDDLRKMQ